MFWVKHRLLRGGYVVLSGASLVVVLMTAHYGGKVTQADHPHSTIVDSGQQVSPVESRYDDDIYEEDE